MRETTSQSLGVVLRFLDIPGVQGVLGALLQLLAQTQWEVRHGGLLGLKYMLAVRQVSAHRTRDKYLDRVEQIHCSSLIRVCHRYTVHINCSRYVFIFTSQFSWVLFYLFKIKNVLFCSGYDRDSFANGAAPNILRPTGHRR